MGDPRNDHQFTDVKVSENDFSDTINGFGWMIDVVITNGSLNLKAASVMSYSWEMGIADLK